MKKVVLKGPVDHKPRASDFVLVDAELPAIRPDELQIRVLYISLDPYVGSRLRGRHMGEPAPEPWREAIPGAIIGEVVDGRVPGFERGCMVQTMSGGWSEFVAVKAGSCRRVDADHVAPSAYLGVLGMPGLTAWAGMTRLARVGPDDTVLIDAAAGAVGGSAGQIARIHGARRVVGIAGGPEKCRVATERYGFDACIDYRADGWRDALADALGDGLTVFFENVSAEMAMLALSHARPYARGVLCGLVDAYHNETPSGHAINAGAIIGKRAQLCGLVVYDFYPHWDDYIREATAWVTAGRLRLEEDRACGLAAAPGLFERLMDGQNVGKAIVSLTGPED